MKKFLEEILNNKKKLRIFLGTELVIFIILVSILTICIINNNKVIETAEIENIEIELNETPEIIEEVEETEEEPAQELTEEQQKEAEKEENIEKKEENKKSSNSNKAPSGYNTTYYIKVNYGANVVTVYTKDAEGNYTVPVRAMVCSTGRATPRSGVYSIKSSKHRWGALFGGVWGQYTTQIVGNILFHSVPYLSANPSNLEYWEYDKLGTTASAGCVRLKVCDAKWIYDCIPVGTPVEFYSDSNPGPLGKPGAQKISGNEACRGWDPTDPDANNPWKNVKQKTEPTPAPQPAPQPAPTPAPEPASSPEPKNEQTNNQVDNNKPTSENKEEKNESNTPKEDNTIKEENKTDNNSENNGNNTENSNSGEQDNTGENKEENNETELNVN